MQDTSLTNQSPDRPYHSFLDATHARFQSVVGPLFVAEVPDLWPIYLNAIPAEFRQAWTCNCCKDFIRRYGAIVTINEDGTLSSPIWNPEAEAPAELTAAVLILHERVTSARVAGVFASGESELGRHTAGGFRHLAVTLPSSLVFKSPVKLPHQHVAEKAEEFAMLSRGLNEFKVGTFSDAVRVLQADAVDRSEKFLSHAEWLLVLKNGQSPNNRLHHNRRWLAVANAPQGWAHVRSSMIGTLLEDIESGLAFDEVKRRWTEKIHPLRYQRPQVAPAAGTIAQAEKLVEQLGLATAFKRRFCRLDEVEALWRPTPKAEAPATGGVFANVKAKNDAAQRQPLAIKAEPMTFRTFREKHLGSVRELELYVPCDRSDFVALTTAVDSAAPLLFKWNNPVSWYRYHFGSNAFDFSLAAGTWVKVLAICETPAAWGGAPTHYKDVVFMLDGCRDTRSNCLGLFPECIRGELHGVRSVIEAFSKEGKLEACDGQVAAGLALDGTIRIRAAGTEYTIRGLE